MFIFSKKICTGQAILQVFTPRGFSERQRSPLGFRSRSAQHRAEGV